MTSKFKELTEYQQQQEIIMRKFDNRMMIIEYQINMKYINHFKI